MNNRTGEIIEKYRKEKGLTQNQLAKQLGVSNTAISKWEHGYNLPDIGLLEPLSNILGIDMLSLLISENEAKEEHNPIKQKQKRNKLIKTSIIILLFILSIVTLQVITHNYYQKEIQTIKDNQIKVYRFYSYESDIVANGYLIINDKGTKIIFDELTTQNKEIEKEEIVSAKLHFYINDERIYRLKVSTPNNTYYDKYKMLQELKKSVKTNIEINIKNKEIKNANMTLSFIAHNSTKKKNVKLKISNEI